MGSSADLHAPACCPLTLVCAPWPLFQGWCAHGPVHASVRASSPSPCAALTWALGEQACMLRVALSERECQAPCRCAQRMGLRDAGVVEGWVRLNLPHPDDMAAAEEAEREARRARAPKRTTPRVEESDRGRDTGALDPLDLQMASPSGKGFPDAELYDEMMPGTMVRALEHGLHSGAWNRVELWRSGLAARPASWRRWK